MIRKSPLYSTRGFLLIPVTSEQIIQTIRPVHTQPISCYFNGVNRLSQSSVVSAPSASRKIKTPTIHSWGFMAHREQS
jgi:hypothetical protein